MSLDDHLLPAFNRPDWWTRAECAGHDPNLFFPGPGEWKAAAKAKAICARCYRARCWLGITLTGGTS